MAGNTGTINPEKADQPENDSTLVIRQATSNDAPAVCELFRNVFREEMSLDLWRWKYQRDLSRAIVVYKSNTLVAHYGGVGTEILLEGKKSRAIQVTDLMVDPQVRNSVRSGSPFYLSAKKFLESYVGEGKPFLLGYGFPSDRAMALSEKLGLFASAGNMWEAQWPVEKKGDVRTGTVIEINTQNYSRFEKKINLLWQSFKSNFADHFVCKKDAEYFRWRFIEHPTKQYSVHLVSGRFTGKPKALLVLRHDKGKSMLMDVVMKSLSLEKVIDLAVHFSAEKGANRLITWHSDCFRKVFAARASKQKSLAIIIPANTGSKGPDPETQRNKWWFMPGDTDYL